MGTDIHPYLEQRLEDGTWKAIPPPDEFLDYTPEQIKEWGLDDPSLVYQWNLERSYDLFAILADVRNGYGFAGVPTGSGFVPIAEARGLPDDLSPEIRGMYIDHTPSWLLWEEICEYPHWRDGLTRKEGVVDAYAYKHWVKEQKRTGPPVCYCGGVSGPGIRHVEQAELDRQLETIPTVPVEKLRHASFPKHDSIFDGIYTSVQWTALVRECMGSQWWRFFEIVNGYGIAPRNLRLVFYFDS